jgi:hypothetical protein
MRHHHTRRSVRRSWMRGRELLLLLLKMLLYDRVTLLRRHLSPLSLEFLALRLRSLTELLILLTHSLLLLRR